MIRITAPDQLAAILGDLRILYGLRQLDIAEASGFRKSQISTWLSGRTSMDTGSVIRVANALGYDLALVPRAEPDTDRRTA